MTHATVLKRVLLAAAFLTVSGCGVSPTRVHVVSIYEPENRKPVKVVVGDSKGPVVLALSSAEPATWAISLQKNVILKEVILQGGPHGPSRVVGTPADVPVWSEIFGAASEVGDYGYRLAVHYMKARYGVEPATFQIKYSGREFDVGAAPDRATPPVAQAKPAAGAEDPNYRVVVIFGSVCCGIDRDAFERLSAIIAARERKLGRPIEQRRIRWGFEGEVNVCFPLTEFTQTEQAELVKQVRAEVKAQVHEDIPCKGGLP